MVGGTAQTFQLDEEPDISTALALSDELGLDELECVKLLLEAQTELVSARVARGGRGG